MGLTLNHVEMVMWNSYDKAHFRVFQKEFRMMDGEREYKPHYIDPEDTPEKLLKQLHQCGIPDKDIVWIQVHPHTGQAEAFMVTDWE
ncbi:MAG: hypothetical protein ACYDAO_04440 [Thermoplasmataceae archaeon]